MTALDDGLLLVDKPSGPTSHDIVARVRRGSGRRRVGHAGTLDPMASGLLAVVVGAATRLVRFLPASPKVYEGSFRLGVRTDSDDVTGSVIEECTAPLPAADVVVEAAAAFLGPSLQVPPAVSARKVDGQRLYRLARRGVRAEAAPAAVEVFRLDVEATDRADTYRFVASVSSGTYIRALARDLGTRLGCGGALATLRRTAIGPMTVDGAVPDGDLDDPSRLRRALWPPERMPLEPPPLTLDDPDDIRRFASGNPVSPAEEAPPDGPCRVLDASGRLLGIAEKQGGLVRPRVVLP